LSETEFVVRERKKKRTKYPLFPPKEEESNEQYDTRDEGQSGIQARRVTYSIEDEIKRESEKAKIQREVFEIEREKMREGFHNVRIALFDQTKSELANMVKALLSDQTIKLGKGKQTSRQHKKVAWGLIHRDTEETVEIELRRSGGEGDD
jgi:DNA polymerase III alpha subunit (gram-positive type)